MALLTLVPFFGLAMPFVLGAKGNAWAWRNGRWDGVEHFKRVQRRWAIWGLAIPVLFACSAGAIFGGMFYAIKTSEAFVMAVGRLEQNGAAMVLLGPPISTGFPLGFVSTSGASGQAALDFSVTGSRASGRVVLRAEEKDGIWSFTTLWLLIPGRSEALDLLGPDHQAGLSGRGALRPVPV